jgi:hypothetical protein
MHDQTCVCVCVCVCVYVLCVIFNAQTMLALKEILEGDIADRGILAGSLVYR